ncbi:hypothetical protein N9Y17_01870 [Gammaproteobacteria bacterium]|nr:hypothetical protein [Gammaproteobacteria bacterium]
MEIKEWVENFGCLLASVMEGMSIFSMLSSQFLLMNVVAVVASLMAVYLTYELVSSDLKSDPDNGLRRNKKNTIPTIEYLSYLCVSMVAYFEYQTGSLFMLHFMDSMAIYSQTALLFSHFIIIPTILILMATQVSEMQLFLNALYNFSKSEVKLDWPRLILTATLTSISCYITALSIYQYNTLVIGDLYFTFGPLSYMCLLFFSLYLFHRTYIKLGQVKIFEKYSHSQGLMASMNLWQKVKLFCSIGFAVLKALFSIKRLSIFDVVNLTSKLADSIFLADKVLESPRIKNENQSASKNSTHTTSNSIV